MKKRIKAKLNVGTLFGAITIIICISMLIRDFPFCKSMVEKATVLSAKTVLVSADIKDTPDEESEAEKNNYPDESESTTVGTEVTEPSVGQTSGNVSETGISLDDSFTAEPEDIVKLVELYTGKADKDKKDGAITELTYKTSGVTDSYENVRVKNTNDTKINVKKLLEKDPDIKITDKSQPTVLIFHTHTTEAYQILDRSFYAQGYLTRSDKETENMLRVGDEICAQLEKAGFSVIHDRNIYDKVYNGAYQRSRVTVEEYLEKYPSIQVTLDIHRDAIQYNDGTKVKPVNEIMGKKCAQMMIISGCQEDGNGISGFDDWEYNLVFAVHLQQQLEDMFPGIMRPLYFCPRKYNMDLNHCSLLIEMGSDANTLGEGVYAGRCLGAALAVMLEEYCV